ncbi:MAG TPA: GntR family transcriptional regulator [Actinospica sp.]|nr:GntR family transcriptional regulator [Actinospica sp.]
MESAPAPAVRLRREPVSDQLFARLRDQILTGSVAPGDPLPSERDLAADYGVNRHAVREAVKRLQQCRLIEVFHGGRTRALDWRRTAGLDLVVDVPGTLDAVSVPGVVHDALEMRACIGADAARLCATRAGKEQRVAIVDAAAAYAQVGSDLDELSLADVEWWRLIIEGCGNLAYLLSFNSLVDGAIAMEQASPELRSAELLDVEAHRELADRIARQDADAAERFARELLNRSVARAND